MSNGASYIDYLIVPYELAEALRIKGYYGSCMFRYRDKVLEYNGTHGLFNDLMLVDYNYGTLGMEKWAKYKKTGLPKINAPMYQQVIDWFRNKHQIKIIESEYFHTSGRTEWFVKESEYKIRCETINDAITLALTLIQ